MSSGTVPVRSGSIYYQSEGEGVPVVLIHAGYLDSRMWDHQIGDLSDECKVIRYDVRGFGKSSGSEEEYSDYEDLSVLLDHLNIDKAVIVGVSNGGRIALDFAVACPERIEALVLMNFGISGYVNSGPEEEKLAEKMNSIEPVYMEFLNSRKYREAATVDVDAWTHKVDKKTREWLIGIATENVVKQAEFNEQFLSGTLQKSPDPPAFASLPLITVPVLMIMGDQDFESIIEMDRRIHSMIPQSELVVIEGADHIASLSKEKEFNVVLKGFIERFSS